ncbi:MAG: VTT domain-containing protein [Candidatus Nezhaarchaeota archaeon]|nr:VTT domain-containing protein [Candidatus Nezhaarchaeota archaeon]MCX8142234.1 VTT domain-containing protein [Candidatus Nezhaarchaeota archaeon]MDW8050793.1 VTT domain-containing protein [Nitrososphaerota archaeon]
MVDIVSLIAEFALRYSYLGVFIASAISNVVLFFPVPYLAALLLLSATTSLNPAIMAVASGLGAGIGKLFAYLVGYSSRRLLKEQQKERLEVLASIVGRGGMIAALIVSATPLPDDIVLVPLGAIRYNLWRFWVATTMGKIMIALATCYFGSSIAIFVDVVGFNPIFSVVISVAIVVVGMIFILKVNWIKLATVVGEEGPRGLFRRIRDEGLKWLFT